jgi:hypothetical protein
MNQQTTPSSDRPRPAFRRRISPLLTIRDVVDVEAYVLGTIHRSALSASDGQLDELIAAGIASVQRLERAMPPQRPLRPVLENVLAARMIELSSARESERSTAAQPAAIAA